MLTEDIIYSDQHKICWGKKKNSTKGSAEKCSLTFFKMGCDVLYFHSLPSSLKEGFFFNESDQKAEYAAKAMWLTFFSHTVKVKGGKNVNSCF